jgi:hypothetical protein
MMQMEEISEMSASISTLTWKISREVLSTFICHESFNSYIKDKMLTTGTFWDKARSSQAPASEGEAM